MDCFSAETIHLVNNLLSFFRNFVIFYFMFFFFIFMLCTPVFVQVHKPARTWEDDESRLETLPSKRYCHVILQSTDPTFNSYLPTTCIPNCRPCWIKARKEFWKFQWRNWIFKWASHQSKRWVIFIIHFHDIFLIISQNRSN